MVFMDGTIIALLHEAVSIPSFLHLALTLIVVAAVLMPLEWIFPAQSTVRVPRTWRLDLVYWFFTPLVTKVFTNLVLAGILSTVFLLTGRPIDSSLMDGYGPLSRQALWLQTLELLVLADFLDYWTHRGFHTSTWWRFHAIHHSAEEMNWLSAGRMHPVNDLVTRIFQVVPLVLLGFSARGVVLVAPILVFYVLLLHSNLTWNFGPLRHVLVSPAYHRWHHTTDAEGIDKNFAGIFPIWDILFGTCYFPRRMPRRYGVNKEMLPRSLLGQLVYPFRSARPG
jgi:sterol desaturase/sphingolipid hydroxylase (fatty acid hydroxylase superfamily)